MYQRSVSGTRSTEWWPAPVAISGSCCSTLPMRLNGPSGESAIAYATE
jgi:hypothetical protein